VGLQGGDAIEKTTDVGKDLLSLIVKANMAHDLPPTERLSDQEMIDQLATFMLAGSETTSNATTWCLFRLAQNLEMQRRLREELLTVHDEEPSLDVLNSLPFFEKVVRESLRLDPPVPEFMREAATDVVLPLATPVRGADGTPITAIPMRKGDHVMISPINANRRKDIWGDDAEIYDPDRFDNEGIPAVKVPGTYGNLLTFYGGARNCV
jgi:cytochrome P450